MKSILVLAGLVVCLAVASAATARAQGFTVRIDYTEIHDRIKPTANVTSTRVDLRVKVADGGDIRQEQTRSSGRTTKGFSHTTRLGGSGGSVWRVAGPNRLINIAKYVTYERAILVTVEGQTCSVQVAYNLNSGETEYRYRRLTTGEIGTARSVKAQGLGCSIQ